LTTAYHTKENGPKPKDKALVFRFGLMGRNMWVNGKVTKPMDRELCTMLMEMSMKASGSMIRPVGKEPIHIRMGPNTLESGKMISKMDLELSNG
jgi:hypothetical protein